MERVMVNPWLKIVLFCAVGFVAWGKNLHIDRERFAVNDSGYCEKVTLENRSGKILRWCLRDFVVKAKPIAIWGAKFIPDTKGFAVVGERWSAIIAPKKSISFGYCVESKGFVKGENRGVPIDKKGLFGDFATGFGGAYAFDFQGEDGNSVWVDSVDLVFDKDIKESERYSIIERFDSEAFENLQSYLSHAKYLVYWMGRRWNESWFNQEKIQRAMDRGYIPVFLYWYFGDELDDIPSDSELETYYENCKRVGGFLQKLHGTKLFIMEPEFNKKKIVHNEKSQHTFARIISKAIDIIRNRSSQTLFSLCMMDTGNRNANKSYEKCGYANCALGDKSRWAESEIIYNDLKNKIDFISFQEMVGQFSRDPQDPGTWERAKPKGYTNEEVGIDYLARRVLNLTKFLHEKYAKPIFLPYIAVASATWNDINKNSKIDMGEIDEEGWEDKVVQTYRELRELEGELKRNGMFGYATMALFDHPRHDYGGYQFFMQNEYHLGIIKSGAEDEIDAHIFGDIAPKGEVLEALFGR
jgi:hypothetical protein